MAKEEERFCPFRKNKKQKPDGYEVEKFLKCVPNCMAYDRKTGNCRKLLMKGQA